MNGQPPVPFLDLGAATAELAQPIEAALLRVSRSGWYLLGEELTAFEREFAEACTAPLPAVGVGSGLDALRFALEAAGIGAGDEVIVPSHTFIASWLAVTQAGATPVGAEVDERTMLLDPGAVAAAVGPRTRAIMPVHLYGQMAPMAPLRAVADRHGLFLLEDAAQAHGALQAGRAPGTIGDAAAFSFYPGKNLGALGDGGAVVSSNTDLLDGARLLRNYGSRVKYHHEVAGTNSRLDELQAAVLRVKLEHLESWNERRRVVASRYLEELADVPGLVLPVVAEGNVPVWHLFVVRVPERDRVQASLTAAGIGTLVHYPIAVHRTEVYRDAVGGPFPIAERLAEEVLSLPIGPHLSAEDVDRTILAVRAAVRA